MHGTVNDQPENLGLSRPLDNNHPSRPLDRKERARLYSITRREKIKSDPEKYAALLEKDRIKRQRHRAKEREQKAALNAQLQSEQVETDGSSLRVIHL